VEINKNEVFEAILNIMLNAIESIDDSGRLDVRINMHPAGDPYVQITVTDTGCGIAEDKLQSIFDRYYTTKESGSGLGLAIVERVISANNGRLFVESEEGKGTTFKIDLPV
jgi:signal transduction histidine kinase